MANVAVLDVLVTKGPETKLLDDLPPRVISNRRQLQFRAPLRQQIQSQNPLFNVVIPVRQLETAFHNFFGQQSCGIFSRWIDSLGFEHEISKEQHLCRLDTTSSWFESRANFRSDVVRK